MSIHELPRSAKRPPVAKPKETKAQRTARLKKARVARKELRRHLSQDPDAVLSLAEWAAINGISVRVARGILAGENPPTVTRLSARRLGIRRKHHLEWLEARSKR
jgi:hypothetical protein